MAKVSNMLRALCAFSLCTYEMTMTHRLSQTCEPHGNQKCQESRKRGQIPTEEG